MRWLQLHDSTSIRLQFDRALRLSTTYVTTVGLPECGLLH